MTNDKTVLLTVLATVMVTFAVLYYLGDLVLVFGFSGLIAYVLLPVVKLLAHIMPWRKRKPGLARTLAVLLVFLAVLGIIDGALFLIVPPTVQQTTTFIQEFPQFFKDARTSVEAWVAVYSERIPEQIKQQLEVAFTDAGSVVFGAVRNLLVGTVGVVSTSFALIVGFAIAPMLVFYLLKDSGSIQSGMARLFPIAMRTHIHNILEIANRTMGAYIRGQLVLGMVVGTIVTVGLLLLGIPFSFLLGIVAGITELIPFIGPWIGGSVGILVTLATAPEKVLWVIVLYVGVQLLENTLLVPRIQGQSLNLHPVAVLLVIMVSSQIWGVWGVIIGPPVVALIKDLTVYFVEQWNLISQPIAKQVTAPIKQTPESTASEAELSEEEAGA